jgi:membrane dipeptidase
MFPLCCSARTVTDAEVEQVHRSAILIDTHNDVTSSTVDGLDIGKLRAKGHTDVVRMKQGGMGAQFFAVYVAANYAKDKTAAHRTLDMIDTVRHDIVDAHPNDFYFATTADGILEARKQHKIAALVGIEGGHAIEDDLRLLRDYYVLGIRYMTLTHTNTNSWADSSGDENKPHNGLTPFGKDVVREMNRLGMMVDIAHVADKTFWDALSTSEAPIFSSHSSCRALSNLPRNMTDEMIVALGKKNGVVQINFNCDFLSQKSADSTAKVDRKARLRELDALREKYKDNPKKLREAEEDYFLARGKNTVRATLADVVENIDHVVKIAGVDHVGLGSDFDGVGCVPLGLDDVSKWPNLTRALLEKGYSAEDIRKIYGGNTLRLMRAVEATAARLQHSAAVRESNQPRSE